MFDIETVLILGAGASIDFGFPVGSGLVKAIIELRIYQVESFSPFFNSEYCYLSI
jgi:hypothetical protein